MNVEIAAAADGLPVVRNLFALDCQFVVQRFRSQLPDGVLAFGAEQPRLSWQVSASHPGLVQLGYEIEASESPGFETVSSVVEAMGFPHHIRQPSLRLATPVAPSACSLSA